MTKRTDDKQDRDKTEGEMTEDGTKGNHNKWDIDDLKKETKTSMEGGSEDGCQERGYEGTINGEPYMYTDKDNDRVRKMIAKIQEVGDAMTSDRRQKLITEIKGDGGDGNLPYSQHLRGNMYEAEDVGRNVVHKDEGAGQGARYKDGGAGRRRRNKAKEEQKETSSESSDTKGEQEVNQVIWDQVWPGKRATARKRNVRHKAVKDNKNKCKSSDEDEERFPEGEQEINQITWDKAWPGTRDNQRWKRVQAQLDKTAKSIVSKIFLKSA